MRAKDVSAFDALLSNPPEWFRAVREWLWSLTPGMHNPPTREEAADQDSEDLGPEW